MGVNHGTKEPLSRVTDYESKCVWGIAVEKGSPAVASVLQTGLMHALDSCRWFRSVSSESRVPACFSR